MDKIAIFDAEIADKLSKSLKILDYSCSEVAKALGIAEKDIQSYIKGESTISAGTLFAIADELKIPVENFIEHEDLLVEDETDQEAVNFLQAFASVENSKTRANIIRICKLYEELHSKKTSAR